MTNEELISQLHPSIQSKARKFIDLAKQNGFDLRITSGYRSIEEQNRLYAQGRTAPGNIVTNARGGDSFHNFGLAFDVVDKVKGYNIDWAGLEKIGNEAGLEHGDRGYTDLPHFQYRGGLTLEQVQKGARPAIEQETPMDERFTMEAAIRALHYATANEPISDAELAYWTGDLGGNPGHDLNTIAADWYQTKVLKTVASAIAPREARISELTDQITVLTKDKNDLAAVADHQRDQIHDMADSITELTSEVHAKELEIDRLKKDSTAAIGTFDLIILGIKKLFGK